MLFIHWNKRETIGFLESVGAPKSITLVSVSDHKRMSLEKSEMLLFRVNVLSSLPNIYSRQLLMYTPPADTS